MRLPATFTNCSTCGRLLTIDANNLMGRCTRECEVQRIVDQLEALPIADQSQCECGHSWSEHTQNPTTADWLACATCQRSCFND